MWLLTGKTLYFFTVLLSGSGSQAALHLKMKRRPANAFMARSGGVFQRLQIGFYSGVIDPQKLVGGSHHVDAVRLALGALPVHELVDRLI